MSFVAVLFHYYTHIPQACPYCPLFVLGGTFRSFSLFLLVFVCAFAFLCVHVHIVHIEFEYFDSDLFINKSKISASNICD